MKPARCWKEGLRMAALSKYFKLEEFLTSSTARQRSIENLPSFEIVEHLAELAVFLDGMRAAWGSGIKITSGFRNEALNRAVGGVSNSVHRLGWAVDLQPSNGRMAEFKRFALEYLKDKQFDELIIENKGKVEWLHLQLYSPSGFQRKKVFKLTA